MSRLTHPGTRFYAILLCFLAGVFVSSEAIDESKVFSKDFEPRRLLRSHETIGLNEPNEEDRAIMDLSKNVKAWAKNTQFVKNWKLKVDTNKVEKAKKLYNQGASYHAYLKAKITPEQLYKAFDLKEDMRLALKYYGNWGRLHRNPKYTFWRTYDGIWMNAKNKKM